MLHIVSLGGGHGLRRRTNQNAAAAKALRILASAAAAPAHSAEWCRGCFPLTGPQGNQVSQCFPISNGAQAPTRDLTASMRLIEVETKSLASFDFEDAPAYAILSHTWGDDAEELTLQDLTDLEKAKAKKSGFSKLDGCCRQALQDGFGYIWIDTCCIDKTDQIELSEAINSMFKWYRRAAVCYVYLSDVRSEDMLPQSRWFRRGWTLQELIAPGALDFYSSDWRPLGSRADLAPEIEEITGIPEEFLFGDGEFLNASVAQRMSWASMRSTKRKEDLAYCLLGIFGVSLPILYGDDHAFSKLQREIMYHVRDDSIFSWDLEPADIPPNNVNDNLAKTTLSAGAFAEGPGAFKNCGNIVSRGFHNTPSNKFSIESGYVYISTVTHKPDPEDDSVYGLLSCGPEDDPSMVVGVPLELDRSGSFFIRPQGKTPGLFSKPVGSENGGARPIHIQLLRDLGSSASENDRRNWIRLKVAGTGLKVAEACPKKRLENNMVRTRRDPDIAITERTWVRLSQKSDRDTASLDFVLVIDSAAEPEKDRPSVTCHLMVSDPQTPLEELASHQFGLPKSAFGHTKASNGMTHLSASVGIIQRDPGSSQPAFVVSLAQLCEPPETTINVSEKLASMQSQVDLVLVMTTELSLREERADLLEQKTQCSWAIESLERVIKDRMNAIERLRQNKSKEMKRYARLDARLRKIEHLLPGNAATRVNIQDAMKERGRGWFDELITSLVDGNLTHRLPAAPAGSSGHKNSNLETIYTILQFWHHEKDLDSSDWTPLAWAITNRHGPLVRWLLAQGVGVRKRERHITPRLLLAAQYLPDVLGDLVDKKADVWGALSQAVRSGDEAAVVILLENKRVAANIDAASRHNLLLVAAEEGHIAIIKALLGPDGAIANLKAVLWAAAKHSQEEAVGFMIDVGDDSSLGSTKELLLEALVDEREVIIKVLLAKKRTYGDEIYGLGRSLLWHAADQGDAYVVGMLLRQHTSAMDIPDEFGQTPLSRAAENGHHDVVALLLAGAQAQNARDIYGVTPLSLAVSNGHEETVRLLLRPEWMLESETNAVMDMIFRASLRHHNQVINLLLSTKLANIYWNINEWKGESSCETTLLWFAVKTKNPDLVRTLLDYNTSGPGSTSFLDSVAQQELLEIEFLEVVHRSLGRAVIQGSEDIVREFLRTEVAVDLNFEDANGYTYLHLAVLCGKLKIVRLLLSDRRVDGNRARLHGGPTALVLAIERRLVPIVECLVGSNKVDVSKEYQGNTPLQLAIGLGDIELIRLLRGC